MRMLLLISMLASVVSRGADENALTVRQKLQARIKESLPPSPLPQPSTEPKESVAPAVLMKPVVVSDSKLLRAVTETLERAEQDRQEERFTPVNGGKISSVGPLQLGSWWSPGEGWTFLRLNQSRTLRQTEAAEAKMKEFQELANFREKVTP
ncbi:hypothetical protein [Horticoccus sp. 23ND18S-11]|uniref:hypothetical protein n=1 Tax=Horticoccus sp. 23ND18S-11 TaxID=3391832 RepID=UPI0039C9851F